jgi:OST-HTH/LOTUS domain-containing protein
MPDDSLRLAVLIDADNASAAVIGDILSEVASLGTEKTPRSFINACDRFIYTEIFRTKADASSKTVASTKSGPLRDFNSDEGFKIALDQAIDAAIAESGRANLGAVGNHLLKLLPDFDRRNYGFRKLSDLVEKNPFLRLIREKDSQRQVVYAERK